MTHPSAPRPNGFSEATGEICYDLPSSYIPHPATGLLHLPRFLGKIRKHLKGELPKSYQRNFCKGFDRLYFAPGKNQVHGVAHANETRQAHRASVYQRHAKAAAKHAKVSVFFHDPHIAPKSQFHPTGDGCAADSSDDGFGQKQARGAHGA